MPRGQLLLERRQRLLARREVVGREEQEREVDLTAAQGGTRLPGGLSGRLGRRRRDGQPRPDPAPARPGAHGRSVRLVLRLSSCVGGAKRVGSRPCVPTASLVMPSSGCAGSARTSVCVGEPSALALGLTCGSPAAFAAGCLLLGSGAALARAAPRAR